ncbi:MAG TPA: sodium:alanine symporter family protein, partial [Phycisphaerales bacterium]|nr:sodium:alanine symporter family protein [Phycisphaerales bacterium]
MDNLWSLLNSINGIIWHNYVLYAVLGVGVIFTIWSGFGQFRALTHGVAVVRGKYDDKNDPGAINHFQALSAALSATVGLGNIAGVGTAVALGGPGAVFWMWMIGLFGMALKMTEVTQSMLFRDTEDPENPHGGPMFVAKRGFAKMGLKGLGAAIGGIFVVTLLISTITGGNMFQAWSVGEITENYFHVPSVVSGIILAVLVGMVIIGGIKRIGAVAGRIVPFMCGMYFIAAVIVLIMNVSVIPEMLKLIVVEAFNPSKADGAFLGGTAGYALLWGMKRALFSSESGQGSSPIAHSAAKTDEPVREGIVAGLEPFIDTIVVCTLTALVILSTGAFNRGPEAAFDSPVRVVALDGDGDGAQDQTPDGVPLWTISQDGFEAGQSSLPGRTEKAAKISGAFQGGEDVFVIVEAHENANTGLKLHRLGGEAVVDQDGQRVRVDWGSFSSKETPVVANGGTELFVDYPGPSLTGHAFDRAIPGLGKYLVTFAAWLFALSTMISWSYYGEQGVVFLFGLHNKGAVLLYKLIYCVVIVVAAFGFIRTDAQLDSITALGTGVMLWANIPIMLIFGAQAMRAFHSYFKRMAAGEDPPHEAPPITDVVEGHDV